MNPKIDLDTLTQQFAQWRSTPGRGRIIPSHLAKAVLEIADDYPKGKIFQALGINSNTLKRWENQYRPQTIGSEFVELTEPPQSDLNPPKSGLQIEVSYSTLTLKVSGPYLELAHFIKQLGK